MSKTPSLKLPLIQERQASKYITVNESLMRLDALVQIAVENHTLNAPPDTASEEGVIYIVGSSPSGLWRDKVAHLAIFQNHAWVFLSPKIGWSVWNKAENKRYTYYNDAWQEE